MLAEASRPAQACPVDLRFALLQLCFLLSGFAALLYQTAWTRAFAFVFGTSEIAIAAVLAAYMGGLALGSAVAARIAPRVSRPVLAYGILELSIALSALAIPLGLRLLTAAYAAAFAQDAPGAPGVLASAFRLGGAFALMLVPTALMGATLPLLARHAVRSEEQIGPRIGALYGVNTAGAILGTLSTAFLLLPSLGLHRTIAIGALTNGLVFLAAAALTPGAQAPPTGGAVSRLANRWILPLMLLSGAVSFCYEVLWTRLLSHLLGGSVQAFATMLASFLAGIALGSAWGGRLARRADRAAAGFALAQLGVAAFGLLAYGLSDGLPALAASLGAGWRASPLANAPLAAAVLLPAACCLGATFPLAVRLAAPDPAATAGAAARVYAWNTVGAVAGAIGTGYVLLPALGFTDTVVAVCALSIAIALATCMLSRPISRAPLLATALAGALLAVAPVETPWRLLRSTPLGGTGGDAALRFHAVGRSATVMLVERPGDFRLFTNGLPESTIETRAGLPGRGKEARWLGFLPLLLRPHTERMLVIGLGGGLAVEGVPDTVEAIDIIEIESEIVEANRAIASERAIDPLAQARTHLVVNDARGAMLLSRRRYDAIVSQPSHPWTAGASHLYTREFFALARSRLHERGVLVQWIGLRFVDESLLRSLLATLALVFPEVHVFAPAGPALLFAASEANLDLSAAAASIEAAADHFSRYGVLAVEDVAAALVLDTDGVKALGEGATPNTDDRNLLESRSVRVRGRGITPEQLAELAAPYDPLPALAASLDTGRLVRALLLKGDVERARRLAAQLPAPDREIALGWIAGVTGRREAAARHFRLALDRDPQSLEAHAAGAILRLPGFPEDGRVEAVSTLNRALALERARDWAALEALDDELGAMDPPGPLFETASRLRTAWRLASGDASRAAEALELLDARLARRERPPVQLERARAAHLAGRPDVAWVALHAVAQQLPRSPRPRRHSLTREALALARVLPDHPLAPRVSALIRASELASER